MPIFWDQNFGTWDMGETADDREENVRFYKQVQKESVWKRCKGCNRRVKIRPEYGYCNTCADAREKGMDIG